MKKTTHILMRRHIQEIESARDSKVLVLAASHLDMDILPQLFEQLKNQGKVKRLDLVLQCRGGMINATRRIALLLRTYAEEFNVIVPYFCQSSGTLLCLAADQILAGDLAIFSPIDPNLQGNSEADGGITSSFSAMDILAFGEMAERWFGIDSQTARSESLALLCNSIMPPSLAAFYRCSKELHQIANELLRFQIKNDQQALREKIIEHLISAYHSHSYAITHNELNQLGLRIIRDIKVENSAWEISKLLQAQVGGAQRSSLDAPWIDTMMINTEELRSRLHHPDGLAASWNLEVDDTTLTE